jgi:predicted DNA binding CopG/RHH family protein
VSYYRVERQNDDDKRHTIMSRKLKTEVKKYEDDMLASFENEEWQPVANLDEEIARYAASAAATLTKDKRINIRLSSRDLEDIQMRAAEEGMPYQTLIASIVHKYASGRLVETISRPTKRSTGRANKLRAG